MAQTNLVLFEEVGGRLISERARIGVTQAAMATAIGVSPRAYHAYEKGKRGIPIDALVSMHTQFETDILWILLGVRNPREESTVDALEYFEKNLDIYIAENGFQLEVTKRSALAARWYRAYLKGKVIPMEDVHTWIELLTE
jgi:transcriptional regulator with XRE-family HTH domain